MSGVAAIIRRTGPGLGPYAVHDNGVEGATHRWVARAEGIADGEPIGLLHDLLGATRLKPTTGTGALPVATDHDTDQTLKQSTANPRALLGALTMPPAGFTFAMVCRTADINVSFGILDGYRLSRRDVTGRFLLNAATAEGGGTTGFTEVNHSTSGWTVLVAICAGAASVLSSGEIKSSSAGSIGGRLAGTTTQARIGSTATVTDLEVAEMNAWPFLFDDAQRSAHVNAMLDAHPVLFA